MGFFLCVRKVLAKRLYTTDAKNLINKVLFCFVFGSVNKPSVRVLRNRMKFSRAAVTNSSKLGGSQQKTVTESLGILDTGS